MILQDNWQMLLKTPAWAGVWIFVIISGFFAAKRFVSTDITKDVVHKFYAEYIKEIRDVVAPKAKIELGAIPYGEKQVMFLQADIGEIQKDTDWIPEMAFPEGIRRI